MATKITFNKDSILKHRPVSSFDMGDGSDFLRDDEQEPIKAGDSINVVALRNELEKGHIFVTLSQSKGEKFRTVDGKNSIYIFVGHTNYKLPNLADEGERAPVSTYAHIGSEGLKCLKHYEGCRLQSYKCAAGIWTLGYGSTFNIGPGQRVTQKQADDMLKRDLKVFEDGVKECITVPVTRGMFDAAVCFAYNIGLGALRSSTLLRKLNAGNYEAPRVEFMKWVKGGGKTLPGLVSRRASEVGIFYDNKFVPHN